MMIIESVGSAPRTIADDEIVVVRAVLEADEAAHAAFYASLDAAERARAVRYAFEKDRRASAISRGTLRAMLAEILGRPAVRIALIAGAHGKPALVDGGDLSFNVSHAPPHLYLAFARGRAIGVDVEGGVRELDLDALAPTVFTLEEQAELATYEGADRRAAFLRGWTRKEAYLKARAVGLSLPLKDFSVSLTDEVVVSLRSSLDPVEAARFAVVSLPASAGYHAALAWERGGAAIARVRVITLAT